MANKVILRFGASMLPLLAAGCRSEQDIAQEPTIAQAALSASELASVSGVASPTTVTLIRNISPRRDEDRFEPTRIHVDVFDFKTSLFIEGADLFEIRPDGSGHVSIPLPRSFDFLDVQVRVTMWDAAGNELFDEFALPAGFAASLPRASTSSPERGVAMEHDLKAKSPGEEFQ